MTPAGIGSGPPDPTAVDPAGRRGGGEPQPVRWWRRTDAGWRSTLAGLVLLPAGQAEPVTLAGSGVAVWELLARPVTEHELAHQLAGRYGIEPDQVEAALGPLLERLLALGAVDRDPLTISWVFL